jgi:hypothetical protein
MGKTIEELEGVAFNAGGLSSHLIETCHRLIKKPLDNFTVEDMRIMIGQNIGTEYLMPLALTALSRDPLVAGDLYEGDLLSNVVHLPSNYWETHGDHLSQMRNIIAVALKKLSALDKKADRVHETLKRKLSEFLSRMK